MKLQDLSEGDSITIDCEPLSGRSWKVIEQTMVDIGIVQYPLVVASDGSERVRLVEEDGDTVQVTTEDEQHRIELRDIAIHNT
jgi:hypothetical protein